MLEEGEIRDLQIKGEGQVTAENEYDREPACAA